MRVSALHTSSRGFQQSGSGNVLLSLNADSVGGSANMARNTVKPEVNIK